MDEDQQPLQSYLTRLSATDVLGLYFFHGTVIFTKNLLTCFVISKYAYLRLTQTACDIGQMRETSGMTPLRRGSVREEPWNSFPDPFRFLN